MTTEQTVLNLMGYALWKPIPTTTDYQSRQLAFLLGYPRGWRVVRTIEDYPTTTIIDQVPNKNNKEYDTNIDDKEYDNNNIDKHTDDKTTPAAKKSSFKEIIVDETTKEDNITYQSLEEKEERSNENNDSNKTTKARNDNLKGKNDEGGVVVKQEEDTAKGEDKVETNENATTSDTTAIQVNSNDETTVEKQVYDKKESNDEPTDTDIGAAGANDIKSSVTDPSPEQPSSDTAIVKEEDEEATDKKQSSATPMVIDTTNNTELLQKEMTDDKTVGPSSDDVVSNTEAKKPDPDSTATTTTIEKSQKGTDDNNQNNDTAGAAVQSKKKIIIVDRIYAGKPGTDCDMWFNHEDAMVVAATWFEAEEGNDDEDNGDNNNNNTKKIKKTPYDCKGGHLLPRQPLYDKNDKVQVYYKNAWYDAKILKRKETNTGFIYQVYYSQDSSKQSKVLESIIRSRPVEIDPTVTATELGFGTIGWKVIPLGTSNNNSATTTPAKYKFISPDGTVYKSKKSALEVYKNQLKEMGDPPWRTTGSNLLQQKIVWKHEHKVSARRSISIEQIGTITGWISATDVDSSGAPGFISEHTNEPAALYHIIFPDDPRHDYATYLLSEIDLEENEVIDNLIIQQQDQPHDDVAAEHTNDATTTSDPKKKSAVKRKNDDEEDDKNNKNNNNAVDDENDDNNDNDDGEDDDEDDDDDDDDNLILSTLAKNKTGTTSSSRNTPTKKKGKKRRRRS